MKSSQAQEINEEDLIKPVPQTIEEKMESIPICNTIINDIMDSIVKKDMEIERKKKPHAVIRTCTDAIKAASMVYIRYDKCDNESLPGYLKRDVEEAGDEPKAAPADSAMGGRKVKIHYKRDRFVNKVLPVLRDIII